ncbi:phage head-tail connector protein [Sporosarcina sp. CAU 1771]
MSYIEEVLAVVKTKLSISDDTKDDELTAAIGEVGQAILNYCNREDIPIELKYVHANMVVDFIKGETRGLDPEGNVAVKSIKEGDVTVDFSSVTLSVGEKSTESLIFDYSSQLNKFRKLRW